MQANRSILCIPMAANASPDDFAWQQGKDIVSPTRMAHSNYGQPVQQSPLHTGQVEPPLSQDDCWFPWAKFHIVGGSQHVHGNVWCTWRYPCCWSGSPPSSDSQCGHAGKNMYILGYVSTYIYILVYTSTYLWGLVRAVVWIAPQHYFADLV